MIGSFLQHLCRHTFGSKFKLVGCELWPYLKSMRILMFHQAFWAHLKEALAVGLCGVVCTMHTFYDEKDGPNSLPPAAPQGLRCAAEGERVAKQRLQAASDKLRADAAKARSEAQALEQELEGTRRQQVMLLWAS
eukprot:1139402-Pelagomonas_calceolata.AAC.3